MKKFALRDFTDGLEIILRNPKLKTVTVFCSPLSNVKQRVKITRKGLASWNELIINFGKPNSREWEFLKQCKKAKCNSTRLWIKLYKRKKMKEHDKIIRIK